MLDKIRGLLKAETAADIKAAIEAIDLIALRAELSDAEAARAELLLTADDKKVVASEAVVTTKRLALERGQAARAALETRLAAAQARESDEAFLAIHDRAAKLNDAARRELVEKALPAIGTLKAVLETLGKARDARNEVHRLILRHMNEDSAAGRATHVPEPHAVLDDRFPGWANRLFDAYRD